LTGPAPAGEGSHAAAGGEGAATHPAAGAPDVAAVTATQPAVIRGADGAFVEQSTVPRAAVGPQGVSAAWATADQRQRAGEKAHAHEAVMSEPNNVHIFFGIYFLMTGLHGIHVLAGMALIAWVMIRAQRGDFGPEYFSPVDFVGLYWHIVDLVWIFLFPLLYLIGNNP
jgi:hypothetical protein